MKQQATLTQSHGLTACLLVFILWCSFAVAAAVRYQPVPVVGREAPADVFSAERAEQFLDKLYRNATPHPAGNNADFRERVVAEFEALGYDVRRQVSQRTDMNWRYDGPIPLEVTNLIITHPRYRLGLDRSIPTVIVAGHFDSHPRAPGAADDGVSVVIALEMARMMADVDTARDLMFVLTDAEEYGMIGARDFVDANLFSPPPVVINIEARGTSGPSLMFETSNNAQFLVKAFASGSPRPFTSSLFFEIYRRLPNDTDFTIYRQAGYHGINLAFIGDVADYHTPEDNFDNLDRRSLQHHGDNVVSTYRQLQSLAIPESPESGQALVYFDFYGTWVIRWWAVLTMPLILLGLTTWAWGGHTTVAVGSDTRVRGFVRLGTEWGSALPVGLLLCFVTATIALAVRMVTWVWQWDPEAGALFPTAPVPVALSLWLGGLLTLLCLCLSINKRVSAEQASRGLMLVWSAFATAMAFVAAGASYLFVFPLLLAGLALTLTRILPKAWQLRISSPIRGMALPVAVGLIWMPLERLFYDAVGFGMKEFQALRCAVVLITLAPCVLALRRDQMKGVACWVALLWLAVIVWAVTGNRV